MDALEKLVRAYGWCEKAVCPTPAPGGGVYGIIWWGEDRMRVRNRDVGNWKVHPPYCEPEISMFFIFI